VAIGCDDETATIRSVADAEQLAQCDDEVEGDVVIDVSSQATIDLSGRLRKIGGSLTSTNSSIAVLRSTSLESIGGSFTLDNLISLRSLEFPALTEVQKIDWRVLLGTLGPVSFDAGLDSIEELSVIDTRISAISGITARSIASVNLASNGLLNDFNMNVQNITDLFSCANNGFTFGLEFPSLRTAANMTINNVTTMSVPSLQTVTGNLRFFSNFFESFSAPNLTEIETGDLSLISNADITNFTFPALERVGGGFTIANNTALLAIDGFPKLETIGGAGALRGSFSEVSLPELTNVAGAFEVVSTDENLEGCDELETLESSGNIEGELFCDGGQDDANENTDGAGSISGGGDSEDPEDEDGAAAFLGLNVQTLMTLAAVSTLFTAFF
jgi:hypothetical protein